MNEDLPCTVEGADPLVTLLVVVVFVAVALTMIVVHVVQELIDDWRVRTARSEGGTLQEWLDARVENDRPSDLPDQSIRAG